MGPAGCGKSTVGRLAAEHAGGIFVEGDDHHSEAARARMARAEPLSDADRRPWVARLAAAANAARTDRVVVACSALSPGVRSALRDRLAFPAVFLLLDVPEAVLRARLDAREGHFAGAALLPSQLAALDAADTERIDGTLPAERVAALVAARFPAG